MEKKHQKCITIPEAIEEIKYTLSMQSGLRIREEILPLIGKFEEVEIRSGEKKIYSLDYVKKHGIWIKSHSGERFYYGFELVDLFADLLVSKPDDVIAEVYSAVQWVKATAASYPKSNCTGLLIDTEMEKFNCIQCGHCCLELADAFQASVPYSDVERWKLENRSDILEWVDTFGGGNDIWINPKTIESVDRCPWLRKKRNSDKYLCRIHETKPEHCRKFPQSKRHALETGCKGFPTDCENFLRPTDDSDFLCD